jgi:hypothetical protein
VAIGDVAFLGCDGLRATGLAGLEVDTAAAPLGGEGLRATGLAALVDGLLAIGLVALDGDGLLFIKILSIGATAIFAGNGLLAAGLAESFGEDDACFAATLFAVFRVDFTGDSSSETWAAVGFRLRSCIE